MCVVHFSPSLRPRALLTALHARPQQAWLDKLHGLPELVFFAWDRQGSRDSSKRQRRTDASTQQSRSNEGPTLEAIGKACRPGALQQTTLAAAFCLEGSDEDGCVLSLCLSYTCRRPRP